MYFIDFHCHIYPEAIAPKAADNIREFYHLGDSSIDGRVETLLERGTLAGVEKFVVLPVAVRPSRTRHINDFILGEVAKQPRFFGYGTIHAGMENITGEVQYIMDNGLRGLKMHPDYQLFSIDDPRLQSEPRLAVVLGTEGEGLQDATIRQCDYTVKIPMYHGVDSLNVAAASAVAFWELRAR